ncbi:MAG: pantetheine-phosphate adenylyltransferase [Phycisphaerae bacterium]
MSQESPKIAVFPGTFDPVTLGHLDVIARGRKLFDHLIVAVGHNPDKVELFSVAERVGMIRGLIRGMKNVSVEAYEGLTIDFVQRRGALAILRGLRNMSDLEYEFQIALTNRAVGTVETVFIMTSEQFGFTSSSLIKQIVGLGGPPEHFKALLPPVVIRKLRKCKALRVGPFKHAPKDHLKN